MARFIFPVGGTPESVRAQMGAVGPAPDPTTSTPPGVGDVLTWDGAAWVPGAGGGGGGTVIADGGTLSGTYTSDVLCVGNVSLAAAGKYDDIDFKPPASVADAAEKGLDYREKASPSNKGGLTPAEAGEQGIGSGVQRAVNLKNRDNTTPETITKMVGFFSRHEKNKGVSPENRGEPWNDKGHVAWLLWGGDPGKSWAEKVKAQMDKADEKSKTAARPPVGPKPASPSQISYAKSLIEQGTRGLRGVPAWLSPEDAPTDEQLADMDGIAISTLIDSLKSRKPFEVERYGGGGYKVVRKASPERVADAHLADLEDACWEGYEAVGMKEKGGKLAPNCVPVKAASSARVVSKYLTRR